MISDDQILKAKILIIDDQKLHLLLIEKILHSAGYNNLLCIADSRRGLESFKKFEPDIILLDLKMPNVDGFQILDELRSIRQEAYLPVLALSAEKSQDVRMRALQAGANDLLNKPYENSEVLMRIRNMIETRLLHLQIRDQNKILELKVNERTKE